MRDGDDRLEALQREIARQRALLGQPTRNWVKPRRGPDFRPALDVAIIGAGMCGIAAAHALLREGVGNLALLDQAPAEREGPWITCARMETLRSPKHLNGPDLGLPALTFRAWYEALHGAEAWVRLGKIDRIDWMRYLVWVRRNLDLPVRNEVRVARIAPAHGLLALTLAGGGLCYARKVVLATGREGSGAAKFPAFVDRAALAGQIAHSSDAIDFTALRDRRVAVLGGGASAFDNAGMALEAGAAEVRMYIRRPQLPQINKFKAMGYAGFQRGLVRLPDALRWRIMHHAFAAQVPPPRESVLRCTRHAAFSLHPGAAWTAIARNHAGALAVATARGPITADFAIFATGFSVDLAERPEIEWARDDIALWSDRFEAAGPERSDELARFPYLDEGFAFLERRPGAAPWLRDLHCFNFGATMSHGLLSGDIPALAIGAQRLAEAIVADLFAADAEAYFADLRATPEEELAGTPFHVPRANQE
jgi:cation diffusion facilitator CzcD-associated flavoprotein CzcO